jgi:hypothetical protein
LILSTDGTNRRFKFHKRSQPLIRVHDEVATIAMRVSNKDCSVRLQESIVEKQPQLEPAVTQRYVLQLALANRAGFIYHGAF